MGGTGLYALINQIQDAAPAVHIHLMGHSFGCIVTCAALGGPGSDSPVRRPVDSCVLVQGAMSLYAAFAKDIPVRKGVAGYFSRLAGKVGGPTVTTRSKHDLAVGKLYPWAAGVANQISFGLDDEIDLDDLPSFGAIGAFGLRGVDIEDGNMKDENHNTGSAPPKSTTSTAAPTSASATACRARAKRYRRYRGGSRDLASRTASDTMMGKAVPFGISADSGTPLDPVTTDALPALIATDTQAKLGAATGKALVMRSKAKYGLTAEACPHDLAQAGWGLVFAAGVEKPQDILDALAPLIAHRQKQAGKLFKIFLGDNRPGPGETASVWLERHGASLNIIDPTNGVPYYLALIGNPGQISFEFQYSLDLVAAVGRIDFPEPKHYRVYADNIVRFESDEKIMTRREMALFATCHDFDEATQLFSEQVAQPLVNGTDVKLPLGKDYGFTVKRYLAKNASKKTLKAILGGSSAAKPSILFSGTHGIAFKMGDERQAGKPGSAGLRGLAGRTADHRGSLVCCVRRSARRRPGRPDSFRLCLLRRGNASGRQLQPVRHRQRNRASIHDSRGCRSS